VIVVVVTFVALAAFNVIFGSGRGGRDGSGGSGGGGDAGNGGGVERPHSPVPPVPGHEVYGYVPYWEIDGSIAKHVAKTKLTTLALFSVTPDRNGDIAKRELGFRRIDGAIGRKLVAEAHERGVRVELVFSSFGADRNRRFFTSEDVQRRWIETLAGYVRERGFDGVNVDVEGLPVDLVPAYGTFVGRLREALRAENRSAQVSVATGAHELGAAMAAAASLAGADRVFLMGYDYRTAGSEPGATAPLDRVGLGGDLASSLDLYAALAVPAERTILGLPLYGVTWPVVSGDPGAASVDRGEAWVPRRNLSALEALGVGPTDGPTYDPVESVEFFATGGNGDWTAVYFDSPRSLRPKLALADDRGLAGAGFWAIGYERGLPGYTDLIREFGEGKLRATE
jgi:spore germination protein YaaH